MNVRGVDPRDIESEAKAVYRVYFWSAGRTVSDEFELNDAADVHEVCAGSTRTPTAERWRPWSWSTGATWAAARRSV